MESVTITRLGGFTGATDAQGNPVRDDPTEATSTGWYVGGNQGGGESATTVGVTDLTKITVYNKTAVTVEGSDVFTVRGVTWKVAGVVEAWVSPWGSDLGGTAVVLERAG